MKLENYKALVWNEGKLANQTKRGKLKANQKSELNSVEWLMINDILEAMLFFI